MAGVWLNCLVIRQTVRGVVRLAHGGNYLIKSITMEMGLPSARISCGGTLDTGMTPCSKGLHPFVFINPRMVNLDGVTLAEFGRQNKWQNGVKGGESDVCIARLSGKIHLHPVIQGCGDHATHSQIAQNIAVRVINRAPAK